MLKTPKKAQKERKTPAQIINNYAAAPEPEVMISGTSRTRSIYHPRRYDN